MDILTHDSCLKHALFPGFSERPERLVSLLSLFNDMGFNVTQANKAKKEWLERIHSPAYIEEIESISKKNFLSATFRNITSERVQWYTRISPGTYDAALFAAGAVCQAVENVITGNTNRVFCAVRPPGHHAGPSRAEGFCVFNNVATGAFHALENGFKKVAIIDIDRHHANGTQNIIEHSANCNILLASSYQDGCKYFRKPMQNTPTSNNIIGIPLAAGSKYEEIEKLYKIHVIPALYEFKPDLIMMSSGFDTHKNDPLTNLKMESYDFYSMTKLLTEAATDLCDGRLISVLEGGYETKALCECVGQHIKALQI